MSQKTYRIGEAAAKLNLKSYVLRFWETEFPQIAPIRTEKGQRLYTESHLALLGRIRYLLHERGLTIDGARRLLREEASRGAPYTETDMPPDFADFTDGVGEDIPGVEPDGLGPAGTNPEIRCGAEAETEGAYVQGSLFPAAADGASRAVTEKELIAVIAELAAIHRLLTGDTPETSHDT